MNTTAITTAIAACLFLTACNNDRPPADAATPQVPTEAPAPADPAPQTEAVYGDEAPVTVEADATAEEDHAHAADGSHPTDEGHAEVGDHDHGEDADHSH